MEKSAIREKSIKGEKWQLVKREGGALWNLKCPSPLCLVSARWRRTGSTWPWSLTGYSSGCLSWCAYWDLLDSFSLLGWLEWSRRWRESKTVRHVVLGCAKKKEKEKHHLSSCFLFFEETTGHTPGKVKRLVRRNEIKYLSAIPEIV